MLRAYELVPEAYRQCFRKYRGLYGQTAGPTFVDFAREKGTLFDRWCIASKASGLESLCELALL